MARTIGDILLNMNDEHLSEAEVWFQKAIEADTRNGMKWHLAADHAFYADWFKKKGDIQVAKEQLTKAIDLFFGMWRRRLGHKDGKNPCRDFMRN